VCPTVLFLLLAAIASTPGQALAVRLENDAALPCPAHAALREAALKRLTGISIHESPAPTDLDLELTREADAWRLEARRGGVTELRRTLSFGAQECPALADAATFIVERHLAELAWKSADVALPSPPPPSARPRPFTLSSVGLSLGGGAAFTPAPEAVLTLDGSALFADRYRFGLALSGSWPQSQPVSIDDLAAGTLDTQSFSGTASFSLCTAPARFGACAGLGLGLHLFTGSATGSALHPTGPARLLLPFAQLSARGSLTLTEKWLLFADLLAAAHAGTATISVEGVASGQRQTALVELSGVIRLERRF
jgi:hypothetical protein